MGKQKLIVLSIDALIWEDIENLKDLSSFKWILENGARAERMRSVYPTLTYVCHTSMATGCYPDKHGIVNNEQRIPGCSKIPWYFYHDAVKCPDIHDVCKAAGLTTASVGWPVTGKHPNVDYLVDETWPNGEYNMETFRQAYLDTGTPEWLYNEVVAPFLWMRVNRAQPDSTYFLTRISCEMIRKYQPDVLTIHVGNMDHYRHKDGVFSHRLATSAAAECEQIVNDLIIATKDAGVFEDTNFVITADHGQMDCARVVNPNVLLKKHGYIKTDDQGNVTDWTAWCFSAGMSANIVLKDPNDKALWNEVYALLKKYRDEGVWGFSEVWTAEEVAQRDHLKFDFSFVLETDNYTAFSGNWKGDYAAPLPLGLTTCKKGSHGFHPDKGPRPTFLACGPAFKKGAVLKEANLVDGAPTYAYIMGAKLPDADGRVLKELLNEEIGHANCSEQSSITNSGLLNYEQGGA